MTSKRLFLTLFGAILLYIGLILGYGIATDWQPEGIAEAEEHRKSVLDAELVPDSNIHLSIWNMGYGSNGAESDFFYDDEGMWRKGNSMVYAPKELTEKNIQGGLEYVRQTGADFYLFQEMDFESDRSHRIPQFDLYADTLAGFSAIFAPNYICPRVPIPILEPWNNYGAVRSGLATYSRYPPTSSQRHQLPGQYPLPDRLFQLDRCLLVQRFPTRKGKDLVVINLHNSAYDPGDAIKKLQMPYLKQVALDAHAAGNYVILGGDWNQLPPELKPNDLTWHKPEHALENAIPSGFFPSNWQFAYDVSIPSNRKLENPYQAGMTALSLIDFYLLSPNIRIRKVQAQNQNFAFSDHQPVDIWIDLLD